MYLKQGKYKIKTTIFKASILHNHINFTIIDTTIVLLPHYHLIYTVIIVLESV
jgi:hypothetical protein